MLKTISIEPFPSVSPLTVAVAPLKVVVVEAAKAPKDLVLIVPEVAMNRPDDVLPERAAGVATKMGTVPELVITTTELSSLRVPAFVADTSVFVKLLPAEYSKTSPPLLTR